MVGSASFVMPLYLLKSQNFELTATGVSYPTEGLSYSWKAEGFTPEEITGKSVTLQAPATLGSYTITLTISHPDYNQTAGNRSTQVIDPNDPLSFSGVVNGSSSIVDSRDGRKYYYKKIGNLDWFTSNLAWEGAGKYYGTAAALNEITGALYSWDEATSGVSSTGLGGGVQGICPEGWSIPTREDWEDFATAINGSPLPFYNSWEGLGEMVSANASLNGNNLWKYSPNNEKSNPVEWNALPGGSSTNGFKSFSNFGLFGFWWSGTEKNSTEGEYRYIHFDNSNFSHSYGGKSFVAASVRCVRLSS